MRAMSLRVGLGVDAHRRVTGRPLILGGVRIASDFGLEAHSDGDVLAHAIMDALLGAANLGDKGRHFPSGDPRYKDIRSLVLLRQVSEMLAARGHQIQNIDASVMCEEPKLAPYVSEMKRELAACLRLKESVVSIKATTLERMGFTGRGEGIAALAVVLVECAEHDR
jgi:2-C-methyl-D-erythritol 2,4-cyclodiphosphate synthase